MQPTTTGGVFAVFQPGAPKWGQMDRRVGGGGARQVRPAGVSSTSPRSAISPSSFAVQSETVTVLFRSYPQWDTIQRKSRGKNLKSRLFDRLMSNAEWRPCRAKMMGRRKLRDENFYMPSPICTRLCRLVVVDTCRLTYDFSISKIRPNLITE